MWGRSVWVPTYVFLMILIRTQRLVSYTELTDWFSDGRTVFSVRYELKLYIMWINLCLSARRAIAQATSRRYVTAEARVPSQFTLREICTGTGLYHSTNFPYSPHLVSYQKVKRSKLGDLPTRNAISETREYSYSIEKTFQSFFVCSPLGLILFTSQWG
jgi:hypothetical protein